MPADPPLQPHRRAPAEWVCDTCGCRYTAPIGECGARDCDGTVEMWRLVDAVPRQALPFTVEPTLIRDVFAALAFLWHEELPEAVYVSLCDPSDATLDALNKLVGLRRSRS